MNTNDINQSNNMPSAAPNPGVSSEPSNVVPQTFDPTPIETNQVQSTPVMPTQTQNVDTVVPSTVVPTTPVQPMPSQAAPAPAQPMPSDPNASIPVVNMANVSNNQMPTMSNDQVTVINTAKSTTSNIGLFIVIILLILFILNVDTVVEMYDNFRTSGSLTANNNSSDNLTDGYIQINESTSSKKEKDITFKYFRKAEDDTITLNYESASSYTSSDNLNIYIELYNASKNLLYKELFKTEGKIEKNTLTQYSIKLPTDIFNEVTYAQVKTVAAVLPKELVCKKTDDNYEYQNKFTLNDDALVSYEIIKIERSETANLESEFKSMDPSLNATYENKVLKYSVDLDNTTIKPLYSKGVSSFYITSKNADWKCE